MFDRLNQLHTEYRNIKVQQHNFNYYWNGKPLIYKGGLREFEDGYDFKFKSLDVAENYIEITFMSDADGQPDECEDGVTIRQFIEYFDIPSK